MIDTEFQHYGVKGMKWGVRRTPEQLGHKKKSETLVRSSDNTIALNAAKKTAKKVKIKKDGSTSSKTDKKDGKESNDKELEKTLSKASKGFSNSSSATRKLNDIIKRNKISKQDLEIASKYTKKAEDMTNKELQDVIQRVMLEKQYNSLTSKSKNGHVLDDVSDIMGILADVTAVGGAIVSVAIALKKMRK